VRVDARGDDAEAGRCIDGRDGRHLFGYYWDINQEARAQRVVHRSVECGGGAPAPPPASFTETDRSVIHCQTAR
jgi:hypothetical protein